MKPFFLSNEGAALDVQHPNLQKVLALLRGSNISEIDGLCRLWISEGIPFCFQGRPMLYEVIREWTARRISIHPKELTIIGSGRIGYSLAPVPKLGREFGDHSDIDFAAVSPNLFDRACVELDMFRSDLQSGLIVPDTERKRVLWPEIASDLDRTRTQRGFIDTWKIPTLNRYPLARCITQTCWEMCEKLRVTDDKIQVKKSSLRVYRDFSSFIRQLRINLRAVAT